MPHTPVRPFELDELLDKPGTEIDPQALFDWCCVMVLENRCPLHTLLQIYSNKHPNHGNVSLTVPVRLAEVLNVTSNIIHEAETSTIPTCLRNAAKSLKLKFTAEYEENVFTALLGNSSHD